VSIDGGEFGDTAGGMFADPLQHVDQTGVLAVVWKRAVLAVTRSRVADADAGDSKLGWDGS
jgi:hypothetical protein